MSTRKKFWLVWLGAILMMALVIMACGTTAATPTNTPIPTSTAIPPTNTPIPADLAASMVGNWNDPDTEGTVTTIEEQNGTYAVVSVINEDRGVNELTWSTYEDGVLSWEYCPENMYCITSTVVDAYDDTLVATWNWSDGGNGGTTYFERLPDGASIPVVQPTAEFSASMVGNWNDPDTEGTVTTIEEQNGTYAVVSVINEDRGVNELTWSTYENGVLSWEYCPESMYCITSTVVDVYDDTLVAEWYWTDGGNGGTTYFERIP